MTIHCAVIDDDEISIELLKQYISKTGILKLDAVFTDPQRAASYLNLENIGLIFLDIEMPGMNGIEFLQTFPQLPPVIITSQKTDYGVEAFNYNVIDYLHKPFSYARFVKAINKAQANSTDIKSPESENLFIKIDRSWKKIPVKEILRVKADNDYVVIYTEKEKFKVLTSLKNILDRLPRKDFMQVHRSHVVQLNKIDAMDGELIEINKRLLPISKTFIKELHERLNMIK